MITDQECLMIESQMDLFAILANQLDAKQRIAAVRVIIRYIDEEGVIGQIRDIVNDTQYDD